MYRYATYALITALGLFILGDEPAEGQRWGRRSATLMELDEFPSNRFTFCRIEYSNTRGGGWGGRWGSWAVDYPEADEHFSLRLSQMTTLNVNPLGDGTFKHVVVRLDDPEVFKYPFIFMVEVGYMELTQPERDGLRAYLLRGGFLMVDDFWGDAEWDNWQYEIEQVLSPDEYPMVDIPLDHPLFNIVFQIDGVPQVPGIGSFLRNSTEYTGITYEGSPGRYARYGTDARCKGIFDQDGRLMVVVMHNTDLADGWEREGESRTYFEEFSVKKAYPMGINIVVYAMTH